jgi:hypothetical protein
MLFAPSLIGESWLPVETTRFTRAHARSFTGNLRAPFLMNQGKEIADKVRHQHGPGTRLHAIDPSFISYQSSGAPISNHAAGFAMLGLAPVMDLDVSS